MDQIIFRHRRWRFTVTDPHVLSYQSIQKRSEATKAAQGFSTFLIAHLQHSSALFMNQLSSHSWPIKKTKPRAAGKKS